ncbi:hypothetical protein BsWGS_12569 [Bradybaena similaris]
MELTKVPAIGIDLGTTSSCVAVFLKGKVEIINNDQGHRTTPSYVAFTEMEHLVGESAESQANTNPTNTIFDTKRLIGRRFNEAVVLEDIKNWPFAVVDKVDKPMYKVQYHGEEKLFAPEEICSFLIRKMRQTAETRLGDAVTDAVVAVPAYFNDSQRQATIDAGQLAGLREIRTINEPTAAALAYGLDQNLAGQRNILIFDLGGGTFDVTVLSITKGSLFEVKSTAGNTHFGGKDFDNRLLQYFIDFCKKNYHKDITRKPRAINRLLTACEQAKKTLSASREATLEIEALVGKVDFRVKITRPRFENICSDLFKFSLVFVERALNDAMMSKSQIDEIVLTGGATRMPMIQQQLREFFEGKQLNKDINPDEAVAYGAAIFAAIISGDRSSFIRDVLLIDVTPLSLGIETDGGVMNCIIRRGTPIPVRASNVFTTCVDDQPAVTIQVFEGERGMTKENNLLGRFDLSGIAPAPRGVPQILVNFDIDENGILSVNALDNSTGKNSSLVITRHKGRLSAADIERMIMDAEKYREEDRKLKKLVLLRKELLDYTYNLKHYLEKHDELITAEDRTTVRGKCFEMLEWLETNESPRIPELREKLQEIKAVGTSLMTHVKARQS